MSSCCRCGKPLQKQKYFCSISCAVIWRNQNTMTEEKRAKISASLKGRPNAYKGRHFSEQGRQNIAIAAVNRRGKPSPRKGVRTNKPAWNRGVGHKEETKVKIRETKLRQGNFSTRDCGNGRPLSRPHQLLFDSLSNFGWTVEHPISLGKRQPGWPTCYKVDLALPERKLAIEVDGDSHRTLSCRAKDAKKDGKLSELGWIIVRVPNERAVELAAQPAVEIVTKLFGAMS